MGSVTVGGFLVDRSLLVRMSINEAVRDHVAAAVISLPSPRLVMGYDCLLRPRCHLSGSCETQSHAPPYFRQYTAPRTGNFASDAPQPTSLTMYGHNTRRCSPCSSCPPSRGVHVGYMNSTSARLRLPLSHLCLLVLAQELLRHMV